MNQDKIKEEWEIKLKSMLWDIGHTTEDAQNIVDFFSSTISQAIADHDKELVEKIEKLKEKGGLLEYAEYYKVHNQALESIINLITKDNEYKDNKNIR